MTNQASTRTSSDQSPPPENDAESGLRETKQIGVLPFVITIFFGVFVGLGFFTFDYGEGASYLSDDPKACANCHIMDDHYEAWLKSSHKDVATCNDCHVPHNFVGKWITKADNGFFHSLAFTTGNFPEPLKIKPRNARVTQNTCLYCHGDFVHNMKPMKQDQDMLSCVKCHSDVGHDERP